MSTCPGFDGTALVTSDVHGVHWVHADPGVHVSGELLGSSLLLDRYEVVAECPDRPGIHHALLRD